MHGSTNVMFLYLNIKELRAMSTSTLEYPVEQSPFLQRFCKACGEFYWNKDSAKLIMSLNLPMSYSVPSYPYPWPQR